MITIATIITIMIMTMEIVMVVVTMMITINDDGVGGDDEVVMAMAI